MCDTSLLEYQIIDLLDGLGASEDIDNILHAFVSLGISQEIAESMVAALAHSNK